MRTIKCQMCGKEVEKTNNNQKYCPECAKEKTRARQKEWRENNKEYINEKARARSKEWRENNKERYRAQQKIWRENNKEYKKEHNREYYENHKVLAGREGNNFCIYVHTDPLGKVYVGRSVGDDIKTVSRQRWGSNGAHYTGQKFYDECIAVYGWDNIQHELIEWGLTYEEVIEREKYWVERYDSRNPEYGYNMM